MKPVLLFVIVVGTLLHAYTLTFKAEGGWSLFVIGLFAYSLTPYALAGVFARFRHTAHCAAGFATGALLGDLYMHYSVFIAPRGSTAAMGLLFMPVWNLLVLGPIGAILTWVVGKLLNKRPGENAA